MNQILSFNEKGIGSNMNKNVKFFAIALIAFGIILTSEGGYSIAHSKKSTTTQEMTLEDAEKIKPEITFEKNNSKLAVNIEGKSEISKVLYKWNNEQEKDLLNISDQNSIQREIDIPSGKNELNIKVMYAENPNFVYEKTETIEMNTAKISFDVKGANIKITVKDEKGIDYVSYRWNDGPEQIETQENEEKTEMEVLAEIPVGLNTLKVISTNIFGETSESSLEVKGTEKPVITANLLESGNLSIEVKCADNIKNVEFVVNGQEYKLNIADFISQGYTIEQLNSSVGLHVEQNDNGKITYLTYEFPTQEETLNIKVTAQSEYTKQTIEGTLQR